MFLCRVQDGRHHLLHAKTINKRRFAGPSASDSLHEFKILVVPEPLPWIGAAVPSGSLNFLQLNRNRNTSIVPASPGNQNPQRVSELVDHRALAAMHLTPVAAGHTTGVTRSGFHALEHPSYAAGELGQAPNPICRIRGMLAALIVEARGPNLPRLCHDARDGANHRVPEVEPVRQHVADFA